MLSALQDIVQRVTAVASHEEALNLVVARVKSDMAVDLCSIFIRDPIDGQFVLRASEGINANVVGTVSLALGEGLVGYVAERRELINLANAATDPHYRYFPESGEECFHGFLGVPLVHCRKLLGVLVVRQLAERCFTAEEVAFLVTVAGQLAGVVNAIAPHGQVSLGRTAKAKTAHFHQGLPAVPGVAVGTAVLPSPIAQLDSVVDREPDDWQTEESAFLNAVSAVRDELHTTAELLQERLPSEARTLIDVYTMMLDDVTFLDETLARIRKGNWAPGALRCTIMDRVEELHHASEPYLRARAEDIRAIGQRILLALRCEKRDSTGYPPRCVLIGDEVSLSRLVDVPLPQLSGLVSLRGSIHSHAILLAKALGIPAVVGLGPMPLGGIDGKTIIVDGHQGRVFLDPTASAVSEFERLAKAERRHSAKFAKLRDAPARTLDNQRLSLQANVGLISELDLAQKSGGEGVGLYRTEFPFLIRNALPSEDEQYNIYRQVLTAFHPRTVVMRTLDLGGDKPLPYYKVDEANPALGWRGIRFTLDHPDIFRPQLRALLRANTGLENLRLLFPFVSDTEQLREARTTLEVIHRELATRGQAAPMPPLGIMVEIPAIVDQLSAFAPQVDFFSVGTNDLSQYLLAVDRDNSRVWMLYDSAHPSVLRALCTIEQQARQCNKPVTVCGELAGDPVGAFLLLGMGYTSLSMSASSLPRVKWLMRHIRTQDARATVQEALAFAQASDVRRLVLDRFNTLGVADILQTDRRSDKLDKSSRQATVGKPSKYRGRPRTASARQKDWDEPGYS